MKEKLPVEVDNLALPDDDFWEKHEIKNELKPSSGGFANILYLLSLIITAGSVLVVMFLGNR